MRLPLSTTVALLAGLAITVAAATERATFILTDGDRISGNVVFHTEAQTNIRADKNEFNVGILDGTEVPIPFDQVVAIDFVGGRPAERELAALGSGQTLVMRSGRTYRGSLVDLIRGDTIRWRHEDGRVEDFSIRQASRIYLQPSRAWSVFSYPPRNTDLNDWTDDPLTPPGTGGVIVPANVRWTDTGITVRKGEQVRFAGAGTIRFRANERGAGVDGNAVLYSPTLPVPSMPVGGLIARVDLSEPFPIGSNTDPITMPASGRLMLGINDDDFNDNGGAFRVHISTARGGSSWLPPNAGGADAIRYDANVAVPASTRWTNTGLDVREGDVLQFAPRGTVTFRDGQRATASGFAGTTSWRYPVPTIPVGALIGRIDNGEAFAVGGGAETITMPDSGRLFLGVNDDVYSDNTGTFDVAIRRLGVTRDPWGRGWRDVSGARRGVVLREVNVPANAAWSDTGLDVDRGELITIRADGLISFRQGNGNSAGPEGKTSVRNRRYPVPSLPVGGLIGRVGNGAPFAIGAVESVVMPSSGRLLLGVNDDDHRDNTGSFHVVIERVR